VFSGVHVLIDNSEERIESIKQINQFKKKIDDRRGANLDVVKLMLIEKVDLFFFFVEVCLDVYSVYKMRQPPFFFSFFGGGANLLI